MTTFRLIPLDDTVVFPNMDLTLAVEVGDEERVLLVPRHEGEFARVGTVADVTEQVRLPAAAARSRSPAGTEGWPGPPAPARGASSAWR